MAVGSHISNEGREEVYLTPFPKAEGKWQISTAGGSWPRWRRDGKELFYLAPDGMLMAASVNGQAAGFQVGAVRPLFEVRHRSQGQYVYDVSADGQRFLINTYGEDPSIPIMVVVNWTAGLNR